MDRKMVRDLIWVILLATLAVPFCLIAIGDIFGGEVMW
jgi:hypothetical protein